MARKSGRVRASKAVYTEDLFAVAGISDDEPNEKSSKRARRLKQESPSDDEFVGGDDEDDDDVDDEEMEDAAASEEAEEQRKMEENLPRRWSSMSTRPHSFPKRKPRSQPHDLEQKGLMAQWRWIPMNRIIGAA
jgi:hypothetical protein